MRPNLCVFLMAAVLLTGINSVVPQPVITSFSQDGVLVCSNLVPGSVATVAWAASVSGPWQTNWPSLTAVTANPNGMIQVSVPMTNVGSAFYRIWNMTNTTPAGMALIPAGWFTMGDTLDGEPDAVATSIYVSAFYMDTNLVSYSQWQPIYTYATSHGYGFTGPGSGKAADHPVQTVDWYDCVKWCNACSQQTGLAPVYYTDVGLTQVYTNGELTPYVNWGANGYRLPTEAEWEKAARGGLSGQRFPRGLTISESQANYQAAPTHFSYDLGPYSGYNTNFDTGDYPYTSPVGYFAANGYGLYDMAGNVWEWCWDWNGTPYGQPTGTNPTGPASGTTRVLRGGSWYGIAGYARCADRYGYNPNFTSYMDGFRCVRGH